MTRSISYQLLAFAFVVAMQPAIGQRKPATRVQTSFGSETPIKRPVKIPVDVVRQLIDENGEQMARCEQLTSRHLSPSEYFIASSLDIETAR